MLVSYCSSIILCSGLRTTGGIEGRFSGWHWLSSFPRWSILERNLVSFVDETVWPPRRKDVVSPIILPPPILISFLFGNVTAPVCMWASICSCFLLQYYFICLLLQSSHRNYNLPTTDIRSFSPIVYHWTWSSITGLFFKVHLYPYCGIWYVCMLSCVCGNSIDGSWIWIIRLCLESIRGYECGTSSFTSVSRL